MKKEYCVFFDVLGTKAKFLEASEKEEIELTTKYENLLKDIRKELEKINFPKENVKYFSDNIFINFPKMDLKYTSIVFYFLAKVQLKAITEYGLLLRGGLTYSTIRNNDIIVIGKGLVISNSLEGKAEYPIIMLDEESQKIYEEKEYEFQKEIIKKNNMTKDLELKEKLEKAKKEYQKIDSPINQLIRIGQKVYINYLEIELERTENSNDFWNKFKKHKEFIIENLQKNEKEILQNKKFSQKNLIRIDYYEHLVIDNLYAKEHLRICEDQNKELKEKGSIINIEIKKIIERNNKIIESSNKQIEKNEEMIKSYPINEEFSKDSNWKIRKKYIYLAYLHNSFFRTKKGEDENSDLFINFKEEVYRKL